MRPLSPADVERKVVSEDAYILFYQRRGTGGDAPEGAGEGGRGGEKGY